MAFESINVDDFSEELKGNNTVIVQEADASRPRRWSFDGGRITAIEARSLEEAAFPSNATVVLVCENRDACVPLASSISQTVERVYFLAGGHLAWSHYYHPVLIGFDENVRLWQINRLAKGCLSYVIASEKKAVVVDPSFHIDYYLGFAHQEKTDIAILVDTDIHQDHVSGAPRLAAKTKSPYYAPENRDLQTDYTPLRPQSVISVGQIRMEAVQLSNRGRIGLRVNEKYLLTGNEALKDRAFREWLESNPQTNKLANDTVVLPAHAEKLREIDRHGLVATTIGQLRGVHAVREGSESIASFIEPPADEKAIYRINATQEAINLDRATELELGRTT